MKIDLFEKSLYEGSVTIESDADELDITNDEISLDGPVRVVLDLNRNDDIVYVSGTVKTTLVLQCSRCLESYGHDVNGELSFVVRRSKQSEAASDLTDKEDEIDEDSLIVVKHDEKKLYITGFVRDAVLLSVPFKPVCSKQCKGLCPVCGQNLQELECGCRETRSDPRWQSLGGLYKNKNKKS